MKINNRVDLRLIEAREQIDQDIWGSSKVYNHSFLCSTHLPYRRLPDSQRTWSRSSGRVSLQLTAGSLPDGSGGFTEVGLPYGAKSRLLLLHLCSQSVLNRSPRIDIKDSFTAFARDLGVAINTRSLRDLKDQVARMSCMGMQLAKRHDTYLEVIQAPVFSKMEADYPRDSRQRILFPNYIEFSHEFYVSLAQHSIPLRKEAVRGLSHSARALDIYVWLAHRAWRVQKPTRIRWTSLCFQFGRPDQDFKGFKKAFKTALRQALYLYPECKCEIMDDEIGGILLKPSKPPIPFRRDRGLLL